MDSLYREYILEHYKNPQNYGRMDDPDLEFNDSNPLCGDELHLQLKLDADRRIVDIKFEGAGCAISQAASSMLTESVKGMLIDDVVKLNKQAVMDLLGIEISATRMKCALLSLKALKGASLGALAEWPR